MLQCEKYIVDAILQKTVTIDFLKKKRVINNGYVKKYYVENSHEAIISKEQYYKVQEELKRRNMKKENVASKRYSSSYPLSGLIICGECNSIYYRVTWQNKGGKTFVWRCRERLKNGTANCKGSLSLKETDLLDWISKLFTDIIEKTVCEASSYMMKTKAALEYRLLTEKSEFEISDLTKSILSDTIDKIVINDKKTATVYFKSGLILEKDFIKTIE